MKKQLILMFSILILLLPLSMKSITHIPFQKSNNKEINGFSFENSKDDLLLESVEPIEIFSNEDLEEFSSSGEGTRERPFVIEGFRIEAYWMNPAIEIRFTTAHFIIRNCFIITDSVGILMVEVSPSTSQIVNNTILSRLETGIAIELNTIHNCSINQNFCVRFHYGIKLTYGTFCTIRNNTILYSDQHGIQLSHSRYNSITFNQLENSSQYGLVLIGESNYNKIYQNFFINNGQLDEYELNRTNTGEIRSQAYDECAFNTWFDADSRRGNYWSDFSGKSHYRIDGAANSVDEYPSSLGVNSASFNPLSVILMSIFVGYYFIISKKQKKKSS
ncbi:MAG: NosD domain-containing protein [Candidatus Thorarchaeota archaeon]